jgi:DNA-binding LytR/AlgR family response regulator
MNELTCLIVDDEELARTLLENYVNRLPYLNLVGKCSNPIEALQLLQRQSVDLIFLDIQMPEMIGTDFLKSLSQKPMVIFTTAYAEYALEGYELNVVDYLLKPFPFERFLKAVNKASDLAKLKSKEGSNSTISSESSTNEKNYILVKSEHKVHRIFFDDIQYIQSMREYVAYYTPKGRILSLGSLKKLETDLPKNQFLRIHKSYIIAKSKVSTLEGNMVYIGKEKIPIGASYREGALKLLF